MSISVTLSREHYESLRTHLFLGDDEQAAFGFANWNVTGVFKITEVELIAQEGFAFQSDYHIELTAETQAHVIKRAFDLGACLVEFHSHRSGWPARFSGSDFHGFEEFVPHVRWRLANRPYAAIVLHQTSFDGLAWVEKLSQIDRVEPQGLEPQQATGLSLRSLNDRHER